MEWIWDYVINSPQDITSETITINTKHNRRLRPLFFFTQYTSDTMLALAVFVSFHIRSFRCSGTSARDKKKNTMD